MLIPTAVRAKEMRRASGLHLIVQREQQSVIGIAILLGFGTIGFAQAKHEYGDLDFVVAIDPDLGRIRETSFHSRSIVASEAAAEPVKQQ